LGSLSNPNAKLIYDSFDESNRAFALEFFDVQGNPFESPCTDSVGINEQVDSSHLMELFCAFFDELLADVIGNKPIEDYHADAHRDIALKYERNEPLSLQDAVYLMEVAHKLRPKGPLIKNKMDEYRKLMTEAEQQMPGPGVAWE
jgi:hypothetical protein